MSGDATCVIFDLDGTLIESEQVWRDVRREFVVTHSGQWRDGAQNDMIGMRTAEWAKYMHETLRVPLDADEVARQVVRAVVDRLENVPVLAGADGALQRLARAFRLGLATSAALPVAQAVLVRTGWSKFFDVVVSADEVARGKPAPDVYLRALDLLGAQASLTAAVEDSSNGIRSAHAAQLAVVAIPNSEFPPGADALALAARVLPNLDALNADVVRACIRAEMR
jgi:beta-phosphoglucomutase-like phosphatase (HAD superfamily)